MSAAARKICVVTGSRADYGCLRWVMQEISESPGLELQVIATGMHLSPEFGLTYLEIEKDGFCIDAKIEMLLSADTPVALAKSMGLGLIGFGEALQRLRPDLLFVLGDRFEIFAAAAAATVAGIPIAHAHGGETTEGAFDEALRHSITKMSHLHFVAAPEYRQRVIQMGEQPERVWVVGALGLDNLAKLKLLDRKELEASLGFKLGRRNLLITFHPVTLENATFEAQMTELLCALEALEDTHLIFTMPNADTGGRIAIEMIERFVADSYKCARLRLAGRAALSLLHSPGGCGGGQFLERSDRGPELRERDDEHRRSTARAPQGGERHRLRSREGRHRCCAAASLFAGIPGTIVRGAESLRRGRRQREGGRGFARLSP